MRARLAAFAIALVVCQGSALLAAPAVLCRGIASVAAADLDECCKHLAPGQTCPMHHRSKEMSGRSGPSWTCVCSPSDAALLSLLGVSGTLPPPVHALQLDVRLEAVGSHSSSIQDRLPPTHSPPPRA